MAYHINEELGDIYYEVIGDQLILKIRDGILGRGCDIYIIKEDDATVPSDDTVFSSKRTIQEIENRIPEAGEGGYWEMKEDSSGNKYIYTKYPMATQYGATFYAGTPIEVGSIYDGLPIDNDTIYWQEYENGVKILKAKGGGEGGTFDSAEMWRLLGASSTEQINSTHLSTALQPYATTSSVNEAISEVAKNFVTINTEQEVSGLKHFLNGLTVGEGKHKLYEKDGVVYLDGDLAVTGGITQYALGDTPVSTIMDGVVTDGVTITKQDGKLVVIGGTGSDFNVTAMWAALSADTTEQINKSHLTNALQGYATTDSVSTLQTEITKKWTQDDAKIKNWDTAFGWGDHKKAGYAHLANEETFTGLKHFTAGLSVGAGKHKLYEKDGVVYFDGDLAVTGGITQYATDGVSVSTIMDGVVTDNVTIKKENGKLIVIGGSGSSFDKTAMWAALSATTNEQINHSHLTTALQGYATEDWVTRKNYAVKATTLEGYGITDAYTKTETDNKYLLKTSYTAADVLAKLKTVDGVDSGLDADLLDGTHKSGLFTALTSTSATNISVTVGGTTKSITDLYANSAAKLETARTIWGQSFDGTKNISGALTSVTDITGTGTFTGANIKATDSVYVNGIRLYKSADNTLKIEGNLLVTGGITQYSTEESGGGSGGGGIDVDALWEILGGTGTQQINKSHLTDALKGYLTSVSLSTISDLHSSWNALLKAAPSGYVTRWPTISEVTNKQSLVVKLNSGTTEGTNMFTYNATTAKSINITPSAIGAAASSHNHSWANITSGKPNSLAGYGITDAPTKTGSGASGTWGINISGTAANANKVDNVSNGDLTSRYWHPTSPVDDLNNYRHNGFATWHSGSANTPYGYGTLFQFSNQDSPIAGTNGHWVNQLAYGTNNRLYVRQRINNANSWTSWSSVAYLTDNVASATKLQTPRTIWGQNFNGEQNVNGVITSSISTNNLWNCIVKLSDTSLSDGNVIYLDIGHSASAKNNGYVGFCYYGSGDNRNILTFGLNRVDKVLNINGAGNVGIGTITPSYKLDVKGDIKAESIYAGGKLQTLGDVEITGAGVFTTSNNAILRKRGHTHTDVLGWYWNETYGDHLYFSIPGTNDQSVWMRLSSYRGLVVSSVIDGSKFIARGNNSNYFAAYESINSAITGSDPDHKWAWYHAKSGDVQRGFTLWSYSYAGTANQVASFISYGGNMFKMFGNILATGGITQYSDQRAKTIIEQITLSLKDIAQSPAIRFRWNGWKQQDDGKTHIGGIAQYVQRILPEAIYNTDGAFTMDYATTGYIFAVNTAKHLLSYETKTDKEINKLKKRIKYLEKQLKKLGYEEANIMDN